MKDKYKDIPISGRAIHHGDNIIAKVYSPEEQASMIEARKAMHAEARRAVATLDAAEAAESLEISKRLLQPDQENLTLDHNDKALQARLAEARKAWAAEEQAALLQPKPTEPPSLLDRFKGMFQSKATQVPVSGPDVKATASLEAAGSPGKIPVASKATGTASKLAKGAGPVAIAVMAGETLAAGIDGNTASIDARETAADPKNVGNVRTLERLVKVATGVIDLVVIPLDPDTKQPAFDNTLSDRMARGAGSLLARDQTAPDIVDHSNLKKAMQQMGRNPQTLDGMKIDDLNNLSKSITRNIEMQKSRRDTGEGQKSWIPFVQSTDTAGREDAVNKLDVLLAARTELSALQNEKGIADRKARELGKAESGKGPAGVMATVQQPTVIPTGPSPGAANGVAKTEFGGRTPAR